MTKSSGQKSTRTETRRYRVSGEFQGRLITSDNKKILPGMRPIDVSRRGFGFILGARVEMGAQYWLELGQHRLRVEVAYCESHLGIDNLFKCGVYTRDPEVDFEKIFGAMGLLAELLGTDAA